MGKELHAHIIKTGFELDVVVGSALLDMYAKCASMVDAFKVFDNMPERNVVSWTAMIAGCTQNGQGEEALKMFTLMQQACIKLNQFTLTSTLCACGNQATLEQGKQFHAYIIRTAYESDVQCNMKGRQVHAQSIKIGFESYITVGTSLIDMYAKSGDLEDAQKVFDKRSEQNVTIWTTMIAGCAQHGHAYSHVGLVDKVCHSFDTMSQDHSITVRVEHFACMVDLLSRTGHLDEAKNLIDEIPFEPCDLLWWTLLGAYRIHGNIEMGKHAAEFILELEPQEVSTYVILSNIYAAAGMWDDVVTIRKIMKDRGMKK
eukprot:Gb_35718 [translate_table: standard]